MGTYKTSFRFSAVYIIESLPEGEVRTGEWLRDAVLGPGKWVPVEYARIQDRNELLSLLSGIEQSVSSLGNGPILHFESHGTEAGIQLATGETISWTELRAPLTQINQATRMNLLAVMGMCHGRYLSTLMDITERAPVYGSIGAWHPLLPMRLQEAFQAFYPELLERRDGRSALQAMNLNHEGGTRELALDSAEAMFCRVFASYVKEQATPERLRLRASEAAAAIARHHGYDIRVSMQVRAQAIDDLSDNAAWFAHFRRRFLMLDLFPENEHRFTVAFEDCVKASAGAGGGPAE